MKLYIESALRIKGRLIICALLVAILAWGALYMTKAGDYTSSATVWVEKPLYLESSASSNPYIDPSTAQANILEELLRTRQFTLAIAQQANIPTPDVAAEDSVIDRIQRQLYVETIGAHLVRLSCTANKDNQCKDIITQTINVFVNELNADHQHQADVALQLYEQQRTQYEEQMVKSRDAYNKYLAQNPSTGFDPSATNPTLVELQQQYMTDKGRYDDIVAKIDDIQIQSTADSEANSSFFRVIDPASDAEPYKFSMKDLLRNSLVALVMAMLAIVAITLVATWADPAVYTLNDISSLVLAEDESAPELFVSIVPYNKALAAIRRRTDQESRAKAKSMSKNASGRSGGEPITGIDTARLGPKPPQTNVAAPTGPLVGPVDVAASSQTRQQGVS